jgi:hypothetical protein
MPASQGGGPEWDRLGKLLTERRKEMDPRWDDLTLFTRERGLDWRMAWDLENNRRVNYRPLTLAGVEVAYGWEKGSISRVLAGGDPVNTGARRTEVLALITERWGSLSGAPGFVQTLWAAEGPEEVMLTAIAEYITATAEQENNGRHLREA